MKVSSIPDGNEIQYILQQLPRPPLKGVAMQCIELQYNALTCLKAAKTVILQCNSRICLAVIELHIFSLPLLTL